MPPHTLDEPHIIHSCTKSVISLLIGIAIDEGIIEHADQNISDFFPEHLEMLKNGKTINPSSACTEQKEKKADMPSVAGFQPEEDGYGL